jgi:hypothetical protein
MADQLPDPLVPAEVDLRGHDWMPLYGERLFGSETWIESSNEARVAALRLWWQAFAKEKPAASLPDSDRLLAVYAGYGEVVKAWKRVKDEAMRGFVLCSDGRWYHKVVSEIAMESWQRQQDHQETNTAKSERQKRWRERLKALASALRAAGKNPPRGASLETLEKMARDAGVDVPTASAEIGNTGQDTTGNDRTGKDSSPEAASSSSARPDTSATAAAAAGYQQSPQPDPQVSDLTAEADGQPEDDLAKPPLLAQRQLEDRAYREWSASASALGLPDAGFLNSALRPMLAQRLIECGGIEGWQLALEKLREAKYLRNDDDTPKWWVNLKWFVDPGNFTGLMEGRYAEQHRRGNDRADERSTTAALAGIAEAGSR